MEIKELARLNFIPFGVSYWWRRGLSRPWRMTMCDGRRSSFVLYVFCR
jgi:hypothetical protein